MTENYSSDNHTPPHARTHTHTHRHTDTQTHTHTHTHTTTHTHTLLHTRTHAHTHTHLRTHTHTLSERLTRGPKEVAGKDSEPQTASAMAYSSLASASATRRNASCTFGSRTPSVHMCVSERVCVCMLYVVLRMCMRWMVCCNETMSSLPIFLGLWNKSPKFVEDTFEKETTCSTRVYCALLKNT